MCYSFGRIRQTSWTSTKGNQNNNPRKTQNTFLLNTATIILIASNCYQVTSVNSPPACGFIPLRRKSCLCRWCRPRWRRGDRDDRGRCRHRRHGEGGLRYFGSGACSKNEQMPLNWTQKDKWIVVDCRIQKHLNEESCFTLLILFYLQTKTDKLPKVKVKPEHVAIEHKNNQRSKFSEFKVYCFIQTVNSKSFEMESLEIEG